MVSSEELQTLWGRVLAGEIKSPGSFSLRTLEFLKNLSHDEALEIAKLSPFVLMNEFIFRGDEKLFESEGITFKFLLDLQNLGIIFGAAAVGIESTLSTLQPEKFERAIASHNRVLLVTHEDANKKLKLKVYGLTSLGKEIFKLGSFKAHEIYLQSVGQAICSQGFNVSIALWEQVTEAEGRCFEVQEICARAV